MKILRDGCIVCSLALLALAAPVVAGEDAQAPEPQSAELAPLQVQGYEDPDHTSVPEPNTMLFAGIGGFILLLFAIRRK